jgi:hypothetical protein
MTGSFTCVIIDNVLHVGLIAFQFSCSSNLAHQQPQSTNNNADSFCPSVHLFFVSLPSGSTVCSGKLKLSALSLYYPSQCTSHITCIICIAYSDFKLTAPSWIVVWQTGSNSCCAGTVTTIYQLEQETVCFSRLVSSS